MQGQKILERFYACTFNAIEYVALASNLKLSYRTGCHCIVRPRWTGDWLCLVPFARQRPRSDNLEHRPRDRVLISSCGERRTRNDQEILALNHRLCVLWAAQVLWRDEWIPSRFLEQVHTWVQKRDLPLFLWNENEKKLFSGFPGIFRHISFAPVWLYCFACM